MIIFGIMYHEWVQNSLWDTSQNIVHYSEKLKNTRVIKMDEKRLKIALAVLYAVKSRFLETQEFIDSTLKEECEKEGMTADEVIFCF